MTGGITRPASVLLALATALVLWCGLARADATSDATARANGLATSATHVVSVGPANLGPCTYAGASGVVAKISDDRGATWAPGPCVPERSDGSMDLDPTDDLLVYGSSSGSIVWLSSGGAVVADVPAPVQTGFVAADDGFAYVLGLTGLQRIARDGSATPCGAGAYTGASGTPLIALADGILVGDPRGAWAGKVSRDDCTTFVPSADLASCGPVVQAIGPYGVTCDAVASSYFDVRFDHLLRSAGMPSPGGSNLDETFQDDTLEQTDALATAAAPESGPCRFRSYRGPCRATLRRAPRSPPRSHS